MINKGQVALSRLTTQPSKAIALITRRRFLYKSRLEIYYLFLINFIINFLYNEHLQLVTRITNN